MDQPRVLDPEPVTSLAAYRDIGGGEGLEAARKLGAAGILDEIEASGLRGRGGAGFPTGTKWRTVAGNASPSVPSTVVVNGAEGEPGSFKDRLLLRRNPYRVLEGALIAALAVGADRVIVACKASFTEEVAGLRTAIGQLGSTDWADGVELEVVEGPGEYLYGEETALLEVLAGRAPFPRVAPPFRHGADEVGEGAESAADVTLATPAGTSPAPPTLVNNTETIANVAGILAQGADWFRQVGTAESPGTIVCTVSGECAAPGVGEVPMGTTVRAIVDEVGGGPRPDHELTGVLSGVANPILPAALLDTPATYEHLAAAGSGLGAAGFIVFDDTIDLAAVAYGVSRFLAVESCGQCRPCKDDGLAIADLLERVCRSEATEADLAGIADRLTTVIVGARCNLANQQQVVIESMLRLFPEHFEAHVGGDAPPLRATPFSAIVDLGDAGVVLDDTQSTKQPDWSHDETWSGKSPADVIDQGPAADGDG